MVTVTDENAVLKAQANVANANIKFVNSYDPADATVTFKGTKSLEGGMLTDNTFKFRLYETDAIPQNTTYIPNSATPNADYQNGVLTWTLTVPAGESVKVSFKVRVNDVSNVAITNKATVTEDKNTYTTDQVVNQIPAPPTEPDSPPQTGDDMNFGLWIGLMVVSALGMAYTLTLSRKKESET